MTQFTIKNSTTGKTDHADLEKVNGQYPSAHGLPDYVFDRASHSGGVKTKNEFNEMVEVTRCTKN